MPIYEFEGKRPAISRGAFVHPDAVLIGDVQIGEKSYIAAGVVMRADIGTIIIGKGVSVQDNVVFHCDVDTTALIEDNVLIGHSAIVHGPCILREYAAVGQGANICGESELGNECLLAAGSVLPPGRNIPARKVAVGNPAKVSKDVTQEMLDKLIKAGPAHYQELARRYLNSFKLVER